MNNTRAAYFRYSFDKSGEKWIEKFCMLESVKNEDDGELCVLVGIEWVSGAMNTLKRCN